MTHFSWSIAIRREQQEVLFDIPRGSEIYPPVKDGCFEQRNVKVADIKIKSFLPNLYKQTRVQK